jgi:hypothetical protein
MIRRLFRVSLGRLTRWLLSGHDVRLGLSGHPERLVAFMPLNRRAKLTPLTDSLSDAVTGAAERSVAA